MPRDDPRSLARRVDNFIAVAGQLSPAQAESELLPILTQILAAQGFDLVAGSDRDDGLDYLGTPRPGGHQTRPVGIEFKHTRSPASRAAVAQLVGISVIAELERAMLVSTSGFTTDARQTAASLGPARVELLTLDDLRVIASGPAIGTSAGVRIAALVRELSAEAARIVAREPEALDALEWRDLERMMTVVLQGVGFDAELTPGSKDGGKDIILRLKVDSEVRTYVVELKHWRSGKAVGVDRIRDFVQVVANEHHRSGLFLATSGYTADAYSSLTEVERSKVRLGGEAKVVSLCRSFVKTESELWRPLDETSLPELLLADTELA